MPSLREDDTLCPALPPIQKDRQIIHQLDYVTKDSEEKMVQIFDLLETIHTHILDIAEATVRLEEQMGAKRLNRAKLKVEIEQLKQESCAASNEVMAVMDMLQYQDFHRQKIERVINQLRETVRYLDVLFASEIADEKRSSSAHFIAGDTAKEELLSEEELSALIENFEEMRS